MEDGTLEERLLFATRVEAIAKNQWFEEVHIGGHLYLSSVLQKLNPIPVYASNSEILNQQAPSPRRCLCGSAPLGKSIENYANDSKKTFVAAPAARWRRPQRLHCPSSQGHTAAARHQHPSSQAHPAAAPAPKLENAHTQLFLYLK